MDESDRESVHLPDDESPPQHQPADSVATHQVVTVVVSPWKLWLEVIVIILMVILADTTLYYSHGYAGPALFFSVVPILIIAGAAHRHFRWNTVIAILLLWGVGARLLWCGNPLAVVSGIILTGSVSLALAGGALSVGDIAQLLGGLSIAGTRTLQAYSSTFRLMLKRWLRIPGFARLLQFVLPPIAGIVFLVIFVLANPALMDWVTTSISTWAQIIDEWIARTIESPMRLVFWAVVAWISMGLLRPITASRLKQVNSALQAGEADRENELLPAFRNTLWLLIVLFAAYLVFEFWTMGVKDFPPDFYYAGYAHEGAFWLTVALGLATLLLSVIFRGTLWQDPRLPYLRWLAMAWSFENLLLAAAVFNRLFIYINFNGMTRMRVVGLMGTATVVVGLILVIVKIWNRRGFGWVIRHQLTALALAVYLYGVLPVDAFVMNYDVRQILGGNVKPSVQIAHHPTSLEGKLMLFPLLKCEDSVIRYGISELLGTTWQQVKQSEGADWTLYQGAAVKFKELAAQSDLEEQISKNRSGDWEFFQNYSFQWY